MKKTIVFLLSISIFTLIWAGPSIVGSMQGWDPGDSNYDLTENANGVWELTKTLAAGDYEYKVNETDAWDGNDFPGSNQTFTLIGTSIVTWKVNLGATVGTKEGDEFVFYTFYSPKVVGDFLSEIGGTDWDITTASTHMVDNGTGGDLIAGDDIYTYQVVIPMGNYEYKIVLNNNWDQDTRNGGANIPFVSDGITPIIFTYDMSNNNTFDIPLPVALSGFSAAYIGGNPVIYWTTENETDNSHWNIYRSNTENIGQAILVNKDVVIEGQGTTTEPTDYSFVDVQGVLENQNYSYWLESVSTDGVTEQFGPISLFTSFSNTPATPDDYGLKQNYPNPFNPSTTIKFALEVAGNIELVIYNTNGQLIRTLVREDKSAGIVYEFQWDGKDDNGLNVSSGIYMYKLITENRVYTKKMILMK